MNEIRAMGIDISPAREPYFQFASLRFYDYDNDVLHTFGQGECIGARNNCCDDGSSDV